MKNSFSTAKLLMFASVLGTLPAIVTATPTSASEIAISQQAIEVKGVVRDSENYPLPGATVMVLGSTNGAITNVDGEYSLQVKEGDVLIVAFVGFKESRATVGRDRVINFDLESDAITTDEVVIIGYGSQKKANLTGAVASIKTEEIQGRAQTNALSAIQGLVPGVTIINRPGESPAVNFRGRGNLGTSSPLYVVDNVIVDATFFSNIDPNTIENISFLKDAASSSIYGSRAAYGVILVTTKKGKEGVLQVSYNGYAGVKMQTYTPEYVNSGDYAELFNESMYNSNPSGGKYQKYSQEQINLFRDGSQPDLYPNTDWIDLIYRKTAPQTQHSLGFTGGSEKMSYYAGLGYVYSEDNMPGRENSRYNMDLSIRSEVTKWLSFRAGVKYIHSKNNIDGGTPSTASMMIAPSTFVAKHSNGQWGSVESGQAASATFYNDNPLRTLSYRNWTRNFNNNGLYEAAFDLKPIKGLVITGQGSYKNYDYQNKSFRGTRDTIEDFLTGNTIANSGNSENLMTMSWGGNSWENYQATANYSYENQNHSIGALLGTSYEHYTSRQLTAQRDGFPTDDMTDMSGGATSGANYHNGSSTSEYKMMSYFARVNYGYKSRYLVEANIRADASSRFHSTKRWGYFPSFSGAWRISEEKFMRSTQDWMQNLKIRASYGGLGNINNVGDYDYFANYGTSGYYPMGGVIGNAIAESKPANINLGWEKVTMTNFGLDFDLFNGLLSGVVEYYMKNTSDILLSYPVPTEVGVSSNPSQNLGKVKNKGFEMALVHRHKIGDFTYSIGGNMSYNKNTIDQLASGDIIQNASGHGVAKFILREGESIGSFYGLKSDGLYSQAEIDRGEYYTYGGITPNAGDIKYVPQREGVNYKDAITNDDRIILGKDVPSVSYGVNLNLGYKNFELTALGQGVTGTKVAFEVYQMHPFFHGQDNPRTFHLDRWTVENPNSNATYPRIYAASDSHTTYNRAFSDKQLFSADYFRIKTLTFAYQVPKATVTRIGLSNLRLYITGENLFTFRAENKITDFDPEAASGVIGNYGVKTVAFGINVAL
ncbi:MAG: SusC/RagA family TonB-linked outer membrane protein [Phocaeicola sp.]